MCMIGGCDEFVEVLSATQPAARKPHKCIECFRTINPGEQYDRHEGILEGEWMTYKTCLQCLSVREWLAVVCSGWMYGGVLEDIREHFHEGYGIWLGRATVSMKKKWRKRDGTLMAPLQMPDKLPIPGQLRSGSGA